MAARGGNFNREGRIARPWEGRIARPSAHDQLQEVADLLRDRARRFREIAATTAISPVQISAQAKVEAYEDALAAVETARWTVR